MAENLAAEVSPISIFIPTWAPSVETPPSGPLKSQTIVVRKGGRCRFLNWTGERGAEKQEEQRRQHGLDTFRYLSRLGRTNEG